MSRRGLSWKLCLMLIVLINLSDLGCGQNLFGKYYCFNMGNYTPNSTYSVNLNTALAALSSNTSQYGFYSATAGQGQGAAHAAVLCLVDVQIQQCHSCVVNATADLLRLCTNQIEAIMWYAGGMCTLRYSTQPIAWDPDNDVGYELINTQPVEDLQMFQQVRTQLLDALRPVAANGSVLLKVSAGNKKSGFVSVTALSALLQCFPTMSYADCNDCLNLASQQLSNSSQGGRVLRSSCYIRYEIYSYLNLTRLQELNVSYINVTDLPPVDGRYLRRCLSWPLPPTVAPATMQRLFQIHRHHQISQIYHQQRLSQVCHQ